MQEVLPARNNATDACPEWVTQELWNHILEHILGGKRKLYRAMNDEDPVAFSLPEQSRLWQFLQIVKTQITNRGISFVCDLSLPCEDPVAQSTGRVPGPWHLPFTYSVDMCPVHAAELIRAEATPSCHAIAGRKAS